MAKKNGNGEQAEGQPKMKKTDAVRAAMAEGVESVAEIVDFAKAKFGLELTPAQASTYKSTFKKQEREAGMSSSGRKGGRRGGRPPVRRPVEVGNGKVSLDDLEVAKALVRRVGAEQARRLIGLFE